MLQIIFLQGMMAPMDILRVIRDEVNRAGSQKDLAAKLGVSPTYISDVLNERKEPGQGILEPLGLERVVTYRKKKHAQVPN